MGKDKNKILTDIHNYLNFYGNYINYDIYNKDLKETESIFSGSDLSATDSEKKETETLNVEMSKAKKINVSEEAKVNSKADTKISAVTETDFSNEKWNSCKTLTEFRNEISNCLKCKILAEQRTQIVFGYGNPEAKLVIVGEAPGAEEDKQGKPFVGRAGKLLTDILKAIKFERDEVYICNILKCRPPENRNPLPDEIMNCEPYLFRQLELIKPVLILALGTFAAQTLLRSKEPLGKMRGIFHSYKGIKMMVTYHPAALLRNPNWKKPTWEDVQLLRKEYDSLMK